MTKTEEEKQRRREMFEKVMQRYLELRQIDSLGGLKPDLIVRVTEDVEIILKAADEFAEKKS